MRDSVQMPFQKLLLVCHIVSSTDDTTFKTRRHKLSDGDFKVWDYKLFFYQKHIVVVPPVQEGTAPQCSALIQLDLQFAKHI